MPTVLHKLFSIFYKPQENYYYYFNLVEGWHCKSKQCHLCGIQISHITHHLLHLAPFNNNPWNFYFSQLNYCLFLNFLYNYGLNQKTYIATWCEAVWLKIATSTKSDVENTWTHYELSSQLPSVIIKIGFLSCFVSITNRPSFFKWGL